MNTAFISKINWTSVSAALVLLCSTFAFSAMAQDKPMNAKSLAALVAELEGVVSRTESDEKQSALVARKWDARKDLTGKSKTQVINLLYEDVKSVIKDPGTQYQISSIFSIYKQMPDKSFSGQTQSKMGSNSKPEAVEQLTGLTLPDHPYVGIEEQIAKLPGTKDIKEAEENARKVRFEVFDDAIKVNSKLTADQKAFVRANYDRLSKTVDKIIDDTIKKNFPTEQWILEGLNRSYSAKFTLKELNDLIAFFDSDKGPQVLKYIRQTNMEQLITGNGGKLDFTAADKAEHDKFVSTAPGKKFIAAYITETKAYEENKENEVRNKDRNADGFALLEPANLNKFFDQFVEDNYRK